MNKDEIWVGKEMKSLDNKINSCNDMLREIILTSEELDFIDHITNCRLDQINNEEDDKSDRDSLITFRKDLLSFMMMGEDLLKVLKIPISLPLFRLKFFQGQLAKFNDIETRLIKEAYEKR